MSENLEKIIGPRVPAQEIGGESRAVPAADRCSSCWRRCCWWCRSFLPYWELTLNAPQYPKGLSVQAFLNDLEGDVAEIDGLNHYIGMRPLAEAATFEKSISVIGVVVMALLISGRGLRPQPVGRAAGAARAALSGDLPGRLAVLAGQLRPESGSDRAAQQQREALRSPRALHGPHRPVQHHRLRPGPACGWPSAPAS
jgi:hypothetical protein